MISMPAMVRGTVMVFIGAGVSQWTGKGLRGQPSSWTWMKLTLGGLDGRARPKQSPCTHTAWGFCASLLVQNQVMPI